MTEVGEGSLLIHFWAWGRFHRTSLKPSLSFPGRRQGMGVGSGLCAPPIPTLMSTHFPRWETRSGLAEDSEGACVHVWEGKSVSKVWPEPQLDPHTPVLTMGEFKEHLFTPDRRDQRNDPTLV